MDPPAKTCSRIETPYRSRTRRKGRRRRSPAPPSTPRHGSARAQLAFAAAHSRPGLFPEAATHGLASSLPTNLVRRVAARAFAGHLWRPAHIGQSQPSASSGSRSRPASHCDLGQCCRSESSTHSGARAQLPWRVSMPLWLGHGHGAVLVCWVQSSLSIRRKGGLSHRTPLCVVLASAPWGT